MTGASGLTWGHVEPRGAVRGRPAADAPTPRWPTSPPTSASTSTPSRSRRARRSTRAAACWSARRPAPARRWSASSPSTWPWPRGARLLHDADQGAVQPEVPRPGGALRRDEGRPAHRRQRHQRRRAGGRDDHRGAAQHALRRLPGDRRPRLRGHGRGALPRRPVPRRGLGRGDHPPPAVGDPGLAVGDGQQRRGVRRLAGHRPRPHRGRGQRAPAGAAVAAHAGRQADVRPVLAAARRARRRARATPPREPVHPGARRARSSTRSWCGTCASTSGGSTAGAAADRGARGRDDSHRPRYRPPSRPDVIDAARPRRPAAGDHVRLQPRRLRRRRRTSACAPGCG